MKILWLILLSTNYMARVQRDGIDHGRSLVNRKSRLDGFGVRAVDAAGSVHRRLNRLYQPCQVVRFFAYEHNGIDIDVMGAGLKLTLGNFLNRGRVLLFNSFLDSLSAGVD